MSVPGGEGRMSEGERGRAWADSMPFYEELSRFVTGHHPDVERFADGSLVPAGVYVRMVSLEPDGSGRWAVEQAPREALIDRGSPCVGVAYGLPVYETKAHAQRIAEALLEFRFAEFMRNAITKGETA